MKIIINKLILDTVQEKINRLDKINRALSDASGKAYDKMIKENYSKESVLIYDTLDSQYTKINKELFELEEAFESIK